jgi:acyl carrier protein
MTSLDIIARHVTDVLARPRGRGAVAHDDDLLELGLIDSISIVALVSFLEERFEIEVRDEDLVPEHFQSIASIAEYVDARRAAGALRTA